MTLTCRDAPSTSATPIVTMAELADRMIHGRGAAGTEIRTGDDFFGKGFEINHRVPDVRSLYRLAGFQPKWAWTRVYVRFSSTGDSSRRHREADRGLFRSSVPTRCRHPPAIGLPQRARWTYDERWS